MFAGCPHRPLGSHLRPPHAQQEASCSLVNPCTLNSPAQHGQKRRLGLTQTSSLRGQELAHCQSRGISSTRQRRSRLVTTARHGGSSDEIDYADRAVASLPYLVPLFDGLKYGKFVFMQYPIFMRILGPLDPLVRLYFGFPFASLIVFFAIYSGIVTNQSFSRYVRYNGMQSILLDILLILPSLLERVFPTPMGGPGLQIYIQAYNSIFLFVFVCVAYGIGSCLLGRTPRLPLISDAANQQVR